MSVCPVCNENGRIFLDIPGSFAQHQFSIHRCPSCDLCYTCPVPSDDLLKEIYAGEYWLRDTKDKKKGIAGQLVHMFNSIRLNATVAPLLKKIPASARILEVGCGSGQLAILLKKKGYHIEITDISQDILDDISGRYNIPSYCGTLDNISFHQNYDGIIFNNVLEHVPDPVATLQSARELLTENGLIFIEVPHIDSLQFKFFKDAWFPLQIPEHLYHFSINALESIAQKLSLEQVWLSTFSPRISAAGYVASAFPGLRPDTIRQSWSKFHLLSYLMLQLFFLPLAWSESLAVKGSSIRVLYRKKDVE